MKTEVKFKSSCCGSQMIREVYKGKGKEKGSNFCFYYCRKCGKRCVLKQYKD